MNTAPKTNDLDIDLPKRFEWFQSRNTGERNQWGGLKIIDVVDVLRVRKVIIFDSVLYGII